MANEIIKAKQNESVVAINDFNTAYSTAVCTAQTVDDFNELFRMTSVLGIYADLATAKLLSKMKERDGVIEFRVDAKIVYKNALEYAMSVFGLKRTTAYNYMAVGKWLCDDNAKMSIFGRTLNISTLIFLRDKCKSNERTAQAFVDYAQLTEETKLSELKAKWERAQMVIDAETGAVAFIDKPKRETTEEKTERLKTFNEYLDEHSDEYTHEEDTEGKKIKEERKPKGTNKAEIEKRVKALVDCLTNPNAKITEIEPLLKAVQEIEW